MKNVIVAAAILFMGSPVFAQTYTVEHVIDASTLKLTNGEKVRLIGVKAPEDEKMQQEAAKFVKKLVEGKEVSIEFVSEEKGKQGRQLTYVWFYDGCADEPECMVLDMALPQGYHMTREKNKKGKYGTWFAIFLNATLIKAGYATPVITSPNIKHADLFKESYKEAIKYKRGLWNRSCRGKEDCQYLACSNYDNPVKSGYQPDCDRGDCKCMCYGCM